MKHQATCSRSDVHARPGVHGGAEHELGCRASVPLSRSLFEVRGIPASCWCHTIRQQMLNAGLFCCGGLWVVLPTPLCVFTTAQMFSDSLSNATIKYLWSISTALKKNVPMHYYCCHDLLTLTRSLPSVFCIILCVFSFSLHAVAGVHLIPGSSDLHYSLSTSIRPPFCTLRFLFVVASWIFAAVWVFTATVPNAEPTVAFTWGNIFLHKRKRPSVPVCLIIHQFKKAWVGGVGGGSVGSGVHCSMSERWDGGVFDGRAVRMGSGRDALRVPVCQSHLHDLTTPHPHPPPSAPPDHGFNI